MIHEKIHSITPTVNCRVMANRLEMSLMVAILFGLLVCTSIQVVAQVTELVNISENEVRIIEGVRPSLLPLRNVRQTSANPQGKKFLRAQLSSPTRPIWQQNQLLEASHNLSPGLAFGLRLLRRVLGKLCREIGDKQLFCDCRNSSLGILQ